MENKFLQHHKNSLHQLQKRVCRFFKPYSQYYEQSPWSYLIKPVPTKPVSTTQYSRRNNLSVSRQLMHMRQVVEEDVCHEVVMECLNEPSGEMIKKYGNRSVVVEGWLYYCRGRTQICSFRIEIGKEEATPTLVFKDQYDQITGLWLCGEKILIKMVRKVLIMDILTHSTEEVFNFTEEVINLSIDLADQSILASIFETQSTLFQFASMKPPQKILSLNQLIVSHYRRSSREIFLSSMDTFYIYDDRAKKESVLHSFGNPQNERIYEVIPLSGQYYGGKYIAASQSFSINIYDLRKCRSPVRQMPHFCEQSPPSVLQLYDGDQIGFRNQLRELLTKVQSPLKQYPLLLAHSPHLLGSSMYASLDMNGMDRQNKLKLLFDSGKTGMGFHPVAVSAYQHDESSVAVLHVDSCGGVAAELLGRKDYNWTILAFQHQKETHVKCNQTWMRNKLISNWTNQSTQMVDAVDQMDAVDKMDVEDSFELEPVKEPNKIAFVDLSKFYEALYSKSKNRKEQMLGLKQPPQQSEQGQRYGVNVQRFLCSKGMLQRMQEDLI